MKPKLLVVGAVLVALAVVTAARNRFVTETVPVAPPAAAKAAPLDVKSHPALTSYRVFEEEPANGALPYRGANYTAEVSSDGLRFQAGDHRISLRARRIEQGGTSLDLTAGAATKSRWAAAAVERAPGVTEEFVFENRRAEHLVRLDRPVGEGAVTVRVAVETNLGGQVRQVRAGDDSWKDTTLENGGLVFHDAAGTPALAYHGAVAIDAAGRRQRFDPRWENGEIALEVPGGFMKEAAYPVVIDPWLELDFSASGGGISKSGTVSETPAIALLGGASPAVAWSDASDGDFDIYFKYWNGEAWVVLGPANANISANTGRSTNPSIGTFTPTNTQLTHPFITWEDDQELTTNVYAKFWSGTTWAEIGESASSSGVSLSLGVPCRNPQALGVVGLVDNDQTPPPPPAIPNFIPDRVETFPCIVWEREGVGIECRFFYPGDNRVPPAPARWYTHPSGRFLSANASAARPTAVVTGSNQVAVAWEESFGGGFDILARVSSPAGRLSIGMVASVPTPTILAAGVPAWATVGSGNVCADVGAAGALSIQPSLTVDALDGLWVAWQETLAGPPVEREIYVARSVGFGGWAGVALSASGTGISNTSVLGTTTVSSFPSIAVDNSLPPQPVVAWEDDAGGNSEIYVRRLNAAGAAWDELADEGSALPINSGGVSRTLSFSLRPKVIVAPGGAASVTWRDGASGSFDLYLRRYHDNRPSNLAQRTVPGLANIVQGGTSSTVDTEFSAVMLAETSSLPTFLRLQIEVRRNDSVFTSQLTHESDEVLPGATASIIFTGLPNVNYHWRARSLDSEGRTSPWISFGSNADGQIDFRIDSNAVGSGGPNQVTASTEHKDKCGLAGLEALALIGLAALARRRRKA